jgi:hypothetical protein
MCDRCYMRSYVTGTVHIGTFTPITLDLAGYKKRKDTPIMASEVARIREQIEAECQALQALSLFTASASHDIINARFKSLDGYHQELKAIVGENEATSTVVAIYNEKVK